MNVMSPRPTLSVLAKSTVKQKDCRFGTQRDRLPIFKSAGDKAFFFAGMWRKAGGHSYRPQEARGDPSIDGVLANL